MKKYFALFFLMFCLSFAGPAFAQDSSRLRDLNEDVATRSRKEARAQKKVAKQQKKLERKQRKLERRQNKTDRRERKRNREERKLEREREKRDTTSLSHLALYRRTELDEAA